MIGRQPANMPTIGVISMVADWAGWLVGQLTFPPPALGDKSAVLTDLSALLLAFFAAGTAMYCDLRARAGKPKPGVIRLAPAAIIGLGVGALVRSGDLTWHYAVNFWILTLRYTVLLMAIYVIAESFYSLRLIHNGQLARPPNLRASLLRRGAEVVVFVGLALAVPFLV